ncbi:hypothetical protein FJ651_15570 [Paucihalobacter ruber]|uniref:Uncharacterized protein n=1 Tax=Paucihalobacter ruber TaxID=2567861 RepID=A0A506PC18_9FLAO|nr:hypothetical protein [Paucihalobacter ruber]TPV31129.1 hypothetical protein FJ651_15570 [Paucihalobacter ruber]
MDIFYDESFRYQNVDFSAFGLIIGEIYFVMAMLLFKDTKHLYYLVDINGKPNWFPHELFVVVENSLPKNWSFKVFNTEPDVDIYCIWGYHELCNNDEHYNQLIEREDEALSIYFKNKKMMTENFF